MEATTREQSKRLLDLGMNPETADMLYTFGRLDLVNVKLTREHWKQMISAYIIPAWSSEALLDILPGQIVYGEKITNFVFNKTLNGYLVGYKDAESILFETSTLLEGLFKTVCELLKYEYINDNNDKTKIA